MVFFLFSSSCSVFLCFVGYGDRDRDRDHEHELELLDSFALELDLELNLLDLNLNLLGLNAVGYIVDCSSSPSSEFTSDVSALISVFALAPPLVQTLAYTAAC